MSYVQMVNCPKIRKHEEKRFGVVEELTFRRTCEGLKSVPTPKVHLCVNFEPLRAIFIVSGLSTSYT